MVLKRKSVSPISGQTYLVPEGSDVLLNGFMDKNTGKPTVLIMGLGFVGTAMSLVVANSGKHQYAVLGLDQAHTASFWKVGDLRNNICPIKSSDSKVEKYFDTVQHHGNFLATWDKNAINFADVIIVDINLDVDKTLTDDGTVTDFSVNMSGFEAAVRDIGARCKPNALILIETTVPPGTCEKIVKPVIENCLKERNLPLTEISIGHSYERVMPGPNYINSIENYYRVYSGVNKRSARKTEAFLKTFIKTDEFPLTKLDSTTSSEMAKVLENSYRAMNISFMVEWSRFAEEAGVNLYDVVNAIRLRPTHANMMYPGIGVGGYCLTKDPLMASWSCSKLFGIESGLPNSVDAVSKNNSMPIAAFEFLCSCLDCEIANKCVCIMGVAYGPGVGDTRFSPVEQFAKRLLTAGARLVYCDPFVSEWPEMKEQVVNRPIDALSLDPDIIVICTGHKDFTEDGLLYKCISDMKRPPVLFDMVGLLNVDELDAKFEIGKNLFILGVGNDE